ncbi:unnamed protein product [Oncorhynchus mykiss]|uniref:Uncharacterized protein n=1 Tax=Oncorhynchus mykiss TaxID=8022 RepID=A0A060Z1G3_ONCMY|nr:unnamed protein product [Oncorhynchus mykiss]
MLINISLSCTLNSLCHSLHVPCRRAVEELLKETSRARVRAETMGPAGWMKCPLRSTNKRFLLNTLRTTIPQRRPAGHSGEQTSECRRRSRTPSTDHRDSHRRHRDEDSHRDSREHSLKDGHKRDKDRNTCHRDGYKYRGLETMIDTDIETRNTGIKVSLVTKHTVPILKTTPHLKSLPLVETALSADSSSSSSSDHAHFRASSHSIGHTYQSNQHLSKTLPVGGPTCDIITL